jgi:16S rRNA (uracil1498-N3)-methyltransferase
MVESHILSRVFPISKIRLYYPDRIHLPLTLSPQQSHYLKIVMRLKKEDLFSVFNEIEGEWLITGSEKTQIKKPYRMPFLALAFAPLAKHDRMRFMIEKAVELGVTHFFPVKTHHTQAKFNLQKARSWAIEAAEQCERLSIPVFDSLTALQDLFKKDIAWAIALERTPNENANLSSNGLLVGPEGGFSAQEMEFLKGQKCKILNLGSYILRAETAVVCGLSRMI